jgi:hypothetical protein
MWTQAEISCIIQRRTRETLATAEAHKASQLAHARLEVATQLLRSVATQGLQLVADTVPLFCPTLHIRTLQHNRFTLMQCIMFQVAARKDAQSAEYALQHLNAACHQSEQELAERHAASAREHRRVGDAREQMRRDSGKMQRMLVCAAKCAIDMRVMIGECAAGWQEESAAALAEMTRLRDASAMVQREMVLQEARVEEARRAVESMQHERCTLQEELAAMKGEEEELRQKLGAIQDSMQRLRDEEQMRVAEVALLCEREQRQQEANSNLKLLLVALQSQYSHLSREIRGLEDTRSAAQVQLESLQELAEGAREQSLLFESRVANLRKELRSETFRVRSHLRQLPQHSRERSPDAPAPLVAEVVSNGEEFSALWPPGARSILLSGQGAEAGAGDGGGGEQGGDTLNLSEVSHVSHPDQLSILPRNVSMAQREDGLWQVGASEGQQGAGRGGSGGDRGNEPRLYEKQQLGQQKCAANATLPRAHASTLGWCTASQRRDALRNELNLLLNR